MEKVEKDGMVAVLVSKGYGAGWSTWAADECRDILCMDADIVRAVMDGDKAKAAQIAGEKCPDVYTGGADDLEIEWVLKGSAFEIEEYDGNESLHIIGHRNYSVA